MVINKSFKAYSVWSKNYKNKTDKNKKQNKTKNLARSSKYHNSFNTVYGHAQTRLSVRSLSSTTYPKKGNTMKFSTALSFFQ